jgi:uncharacterized membrane protein
VPTSEYDSYARRESQSIEMRLTRRMSSFQHPICVLRVSNDLTLPFYLKMAGCFLQERRTGKVVNIEPGFGRHFEDEIELNKRKYEDYKEKQVYPPQ